MLPSPLRVDPLFPAHGRDWHDYVLPDGANLFDASDSPCLASEEQPCLHGGELRKSTLETRTTCAGLRARDLLGVLRWLCREEPLVTFYSVGIAPGRGLRDLVWRG